MALVPFSNYTTEVAPHVDGCPTAVMTAYIRKVFIDLCERAKIWRVPLTDVPLVAGTYDYSLVSPIAGTEVSALLVAQVTTASNPTAVTNLPVSTMEVALSRFPDWPNLNAESAPYMLFQQSPSQFSVAPVPDNKDTYTVRLRAAIRPTISAVNVEDSLMNEYRRAWFHGAIHELMAMPGRHWSNDKLALYHGKQWEYFLNNAKARANKGFGRASISVAQRPWA